MIDFLAREPHFLDHLAPLWHALPEALRGRVYVDEDLVQRGLDRDLPAEPLDRRGDRDVLTVVASYRDLKLARRGGRRVVYSEHGAGQSYIDAKTGDPIGNGSYIGAPDRAGVVAVLVPGPMQAAKHERSHPTIPAYPVGVPKLDPHHLRTGRPAGSTVALSFHWACRLVPEARGIHTHYHRVFAEIAQEFDVIGHGHPRIIDQLGHYYRRAGIEVVEDFEEVIERAGVYVCDNSSTMYEWASLDRPVVVLNAQNLYRRGVEHGLRFWSHADLGPQVWMRSKLAGAIRTALDDPPEQAERRREIVRDVYLACDGKAAQRGAEALQEIHAEWNGGEPWSRT